MPDINSNISDKLVWLVNTGKEEDRVIILELKKVVMFEPNRPVQLPWSIAQRYMNRSIKLCSNPEAYFDSRPLRHLTVRDAGIGDLILLEPCLRELKKKGNRIVGIASRYPEVYNNHPCIDKNIRMKTKDDSTGYNTDDFDCWDDLRNYSESCKSRATKHRTDCYNEIYDLKISDEDKQPRIYFDKNETQILKKRKGYKYIGVNFDASHRFRRYHHGEAAIQYLLDADPKNIIVILGSYDFVKYKKSRRVIDYQGKIDISQLINIVVDLDYLIAVDSGVMHIALATHTPVVGLFSIIKPDLRLKYYMGHRRVIYPENIECAGCGSYHMAVCKHEPVKSADTYTPPCMDIKPETMLEKMNEMPLNPDKRKFYPGDEDVPKEVKEVKPVNVNIITEKKLTMPIIVQDESHNLPMFIENVINHPAIGRVVAIDGGSTDNTVELLEKAGAEVYVHPYIKTYHDQQAMQRNISCSYIRNDTPILLMDVDETFSKELSEYLPYLANQTAYRFGLVYRRTFNYYNEINDPSKAIKDWPDPQPRYYIWDWKYKFVGGAHHRTMNCPEPFMIDKPILHFEKESGKRDDMEKQWASMMQGVRKYG